MIRLRTGNAYWRGCVPYASSLMIRPDARTRSNSMRCRRGYTTSSPVATTPITAPPASSAPSCTAPSMPIASPLTTVTPARAKRGAELARVVEPVRGRRARAHDRDPRAVERLRHVALGQQHLGTVGELLVERIPRTPGHVDARPLAPRASRAVRSLRAAACHARASDCRAGSSSPDAPSHSTADANPRSRPASAPTGPPPRSTSARSRRWVMSGSDANVAAATSTGSSGAGAGPAHGTSPRMPARGLEVVAGDARAVVEVGERARHPTDPGGAAPGELPVGDELAPHLVGVGAERQQPRHRAGGDVRVLRPRPVGVARALSLVRDDDPRRDLGRRLAGFVVRLGRVDAHAQVEPVEQRRAQPSAVALALRVAAAALVAAPSRTGTGWSTPPAGTRRGT